MTEKHRDWFPAGQYFVGVAGMAAMRRILSRPSEGRARIDEVRAVIESYDEFPNDLRIDVVEHDVDSGYTGMGARDTTGRTSPGSATSTPIRRRASPCRSSSGAGRSPSPDGETVSGRRQARPARRWRR